MGPVSPRERFAAAAEAGERAALVTRLVPELPAAERHLLLLADGSTVGGTGDAARDRALLAAAEAVLWDARGTRTAVGGEEVFVDVVAPPPRMLVFGAVPVADALTRFAGALGWRSVVVDPRTRFARADRFPAAERVIDEWPDRALALLPPIDAATAVLVLTHDPKIDDQALVHALRSPAFYVGAIGSRVATAARLQRLDELGMTPDELRRLVSPCGLDIGGSSPEETALSMLAEVVAVRAGRPGGRLADGRGPIHGPVPGADPAAATAGADHVPADAPAGRVPASPGSVTDSGSAGS
jgi:xanthine dehydrogenase accessory factor